MKHCIFGFFLMAGLVHSILIYGQNNVIESLVIDQTTGKPLASANIYTNDGYGTVTNSEGYFSIYPPQDGIIKVSYLGYENGIFRIDTIGRVLQLRPILYDIQPAVVLSINGDALVGAIFKKYKPLAYDYSAIRHNYFFRQFTFEYNKYTELVEAIFDGRSAICLREPSLLKGRYATLQRDSTTSYNTFPSFFNFSQLSFLCPKKIDKHTVMVPISPESSKYYDISVDLMVAKNEKDIYVIHFKPKEVVQRPICKGDLYVSADSLTIMRYEGILNYPISVKETKQDLSIDIRFTIDYLYNDSVPIVNNATVTTEFVYKNLFNKNSLCKVHSILSMIGQEILLQGKRHSLKEGTHLLGKITTLEDDIEFWSNNPIIKRTPLEEDAITMFQNLNLIGNYHP